MLSFILPEHVLNDTNATNILKINLFQIKKVFVFD